MKVINPFDFEELIKQIKHEYGFDLRKDLKDNKLHEEDFLMIIQDLHLAMEAIPPNAYTVSADGSYKVYKTRYKDNNRNNGASGAYRIISMSDGEKVIPFHLYHKRSGKKPKKDLTEREKKMVKKMIDDAVSQKRGG